MHAAASYLQQTQSAVQKLFEGILSYTAILKAIHGTTFVSGELDPTKFQAEYDAWAQNNAAKLAASLAAQRQYSEQAFAMATLCGAVLQVAAKAIECYSGNEIVPRSVQAIVGNSAKAIPFCIGREVRGVPIGLVIYAGRNQHMHHNEASLSAVNQAVFDRLAVLPQHPHIKDPALDLANTLLESHASNITYVLGWRSYEAYAADLRSLLGT
jgi:hypothetical protein